MKVYWAAKRQKLLSVASSLAAESLELDEHAAESYSLAEPGGIGTSAERNPITNLDSRPRESSSRSLCLSVIVSPNFESRRTKWHSSAFFAQLRKVQITASWVGFFAPGESVAAKLSQ